MKLRAVLLGLTAVTFLGASSFASTVGPRYTNHPGVAHHQQPPITPNDTVVYDNGPDDGVNAYTINGGYDVSNSFILGANANLTSVAFSNWFLPGLEPGSSVNWAVTTELGGGTTLFSGVGSLTNIFLGMNSLGADVYNATFSLGGIGLATGSYYLDLSNEVVGGGGPGYWGESAGPSVACQSGNGLVCVSIPSEAFQISGTGVAPPPIPEPSSLVLLGTGLLGAAGALRRKFSV